MVLVCSRKGACLVRKPGKKVENVSTSSQAPKSQHFQLFFPGLRTRHASLASQDHVIASLAEEDLKSILLDLKSMTDGVETL